MTLRQTIQKIALDSVGANVPVQLVSGTVISTAPLEIRLNNNHKLPIPEDILSVAEHLTAYRTTIDIPGMGKTECEMDNRLKTNDAVMLLMMQGGQSFFVIDRIK